MQEENRIFVRENVRIEQKQNRSRSGEDIEAMLRFSLWKTVHRFHVYSGCLDCADNFFNDVDFRLQIICNGDGVIPAL